MRSPTHQKGAILVMTAAFTVAAIALLALAIDTGRLYAAQSKLQTTANLAALAAANEASGCRTTHGDITGKSAALASINQNYSDTTQADRPQLVTGAYQQGVVSANPATHVRSFSSAYDAATEKPDAVRLTLAENNFKPLFSLFGGSRTLRASAGATSGPTAQLQFGTTLANIDPKLLASLLGINVSVLNVGNLANARVTLAQLLDINADLATQQQLADITINQALDNVSDALSTVTPALLNAIRDSVGDRPLGSILGIAGSIGTSASISLGAIINGAAQLVAKERHTPVQIPLNLSLLQGKLLNLSVTAKILEPAKSVLGSAGINDSTGDYYTKVYAAQVGLSLALDLDVLKAVVVHLPLALQVGQGMAGLASIRCPSISQPYYAVSIEGETAPLALAIGSIGADDSIDTSDSATVSLLGINIASISNDNNQISTLIQHDFSHTYGDSQDPIDDLDKLPKTYTPKNTLRVHDLTTLLSGLHLKVDLLDNKEICERISQGRPLTNLLCNVVNGLGEIVSGITRPLLDATLNGLVSGVLLPLLDPVLSPILDPILNALGISVADPTISLIKLNPSQERLFCASYADCYK